MAIADNIKTLGRTISAHSPAILTAVGVAGVVATTILAVRATPDALARIYVDTENKGEDLTPFETVKSTWPVYVPAALMAGVTITCIVSSTSISARRQAALLGLYTITETGFREYQEKVREHMTPRAEEKVRDAVAKDSIEKHPLKAESREVILVGNGSVLCFDSLTARYFMSDMETLRKAENDLNQKILTHMGYASQNDWYRLIGLPVVVMGDEAGWRTDNLLEIDYSAQLSDENEPCMVLNYRMYPIGSYADPFRS